jgi:hypothetical protein
MIQFSRHAERRMKLYHITKHDVKFIIDQGRREISHGEKISHIHDIGGKFKYPIKVVGIKKEESFLVVTAYPLKRGKK